VVEADHVDIQTLNACRPGLGANRYFFDLPKKSFLFEISRVLGKNALKNSFEGGMLPSFLVSIFVLFMKHLFELSSRNQNQILKSIFKADFCRDFFHGKFHTFFFLGTCSIYSCRESNDRASR